MVLREYPGQAMSYRVLQDWAEIGIGAAILPLSKAAPGTGAPIVAAAGQAGRLHIAYHALWRNPVDARSGMGRFARYLVDVAPAIVAGLVPSPARPLA